MAPPSKSTPSNRNQVIYKKIGQTELDKIVILHERYLKTLVGGARASLKFCDISFCDLTRRNLSGADLTGCRIANGNLTEINFSNACLFGADLSNVKCPGGNFNKADMRGCILQNGDYQEAILKMPICLMQI